MNTLLRTMIPMTALASLVTVAHAQGQAQAPAKAEAPRAPTAEMPAPAPAPVRANKVEKGAAEKAMMPKADPVARKMPPVPAPVPPPMPSAPPQIAALAKAAGAWRCTGTAMGTNGEQKLVATVRNRLDVDKWWVHTSFAELGGGKYKFEAYTTYDAKTNKWHRVMVDNMGGQELASSDGAKDGVTRWDATSRSIIGEGMARHFEDLTNPKALRMWGEYSVDRGRTWSKAYDTTCKR